MCDFHTLLHSNVQRVCNALVVEVSSWLVPIQASEKIWLSTQKLKTFDPVGGTAFNDTVRNLPHTPRSDDLLYNTARRVVGVKRFKTNKIKLATSGHVNVLIRKRGSQIDSAL